MNINHIIIVNQFLVGSAETNRILAYAKEFKELGLAVSIIFHCSHHFDLKYDDSIKIYKVISSYSSVISYYKMSLLIKSIYKEGSVILEYGTPILCALLNTNKYGIFVEYTEIPLFGRKATLMGRLKEYVKIVLTRRAKGVFVISKALERYYKTKGIANVDIINMFVDSRRFQNVIQNTDQTVKYIAYCGTIDESKDGVSDLIYAFALFHKTHSDYHLKIIGRVVDDGVQDTLDCIIRENGIGDYVELTGLIDSEEMPRLLCGASVLALARPNNTQALYGFPTKLGEYLCTGNPVVVTDVGEIGHFLKDRIHCVFAEADNYVDFADKLCWVVDHPEQSLMIGKQGRKLCENVFSSQIMAKKALGFMKSI